MATLYELTSNYRKLQSLANETDPEVFNDTMASIDDAIQDKAVGYAKVINSMDADVADISEEIKRLKDRKSTIERNIGYMKINLINAFHNADIKQVKDSLFTVKIRHNPESVLLMDENKIPVDYYQEQPMKLSKTLIKEALKNGKEVPGAELTRSESLMIK
ncbi:siphovirus Gp157 family protein [Loigolactobacillus coryniformis]|uniref:siphovirus Gp157 family protein n=1 Tax=Loigolactobacillus coryniformis TaxID=1610 RepID=UPI00345CE7D3